MENSKSIENLEIEDRLMKIHDGIFKTLKSNDYETRYCKALDFALLEINNLYIELLDNKYSRRDEKSVKEERRENE